MKFRCNTCKAPIKATEHGYACANGHSYTVTPEGVIDMRREKEPAGRTGNSLEIVQSKKDFLNEGFFSILSEAIADTVSRLCDRCPNPAVIADCCCGEGYYTRNLLEELKKSEKQVELFAFDLSKDAVHMAAEQSNGGIYACADVYDIPLEDESVDIVLNCFGPTPDEEIARILKPGGIFLAVIPGRMHLYAMKTALFDVPTVVDETGHISKRLVRAKQMRVRDEIALEHTKDLENLFSMTPEMVREGEYYKEKLGTLKDLEMEIDFILQIFRKPKK